MLQSLKAEARKNCGKIKSKKLQFENAQVSYFNVVYPYIIVFFFSEGAKKAILGQFFLLTRTGNFNDSALLVNKRKDAAQILTDHMIQSFGIASMV